MFRCLWYASNNKLYYDNTWHQYRFQEDPDILLPTEDNGPLHENAAHMNEVVSNLLLAGLFVQTPGLDEQLVICHQLLHNCNACNILTVYVWLHVFSVIKNGMFIDWVLKKSRKVWAIKDKTWANSFFCMLHKHYVWLSICQWK